MKGILNVQEFIWSQVIWACGVRIVATLCGSEVARCRQSNVDAWGGGTRDVLSASYSSNTASRLVEGTKTRVNAGAGGDELLQRELLEINSDQGILKFVRETTEQRSLARSIIVARSFDVFREFSVVHGELPVSLPQAVDVVLSCDLSVGITEDAGEVVQQCLRSGKREGKKVAWREP